MKFFAQIILLGLLLINTAVAQERHLRNYTMLHALPEQVLPTINAQLSAGSSVQPFRQQLILNVTDSEFRAITSLLQQIDTAPRSLLISVRKQGQQFQKNENYGVDGRIGNGAVQIQNGENNQSGDDRQRRTETRVTINQGNMRSSSDGSQQVRAVEGMSAFISAGNAIPVRSGPYGQQQLTDVDSGFFANARIVGAEVIVDIDQHDDRVQQRSITTQSLQTQVRGRIGEWISLGGISDQRGGSDSSYTSSRSGSSSALADIAIKVDVINN
ncbi:MAG: secretin [Verrucomicrobiaceae bacterium]|nr:secretin [Verrucomicrobiaceae bacterium]